MGQKRPYVRRVLIIECKDLEFAKTHGEIARQMFEFRGADDKKGRPDRLKHHLQRFEVLVAQPERVGRYVGLQGPIRLELHLVFHNPVPMPLDPSEALRRVRVSVFSSLDHC